MLLPVTCCVFVLLMSRGRRGQNAAHDLLSKQNVVCTQKNKGCSTGSTHLSKARCGGLDWAQELWFGSRSRSSPSTGKALGFPGLVWLFSQRLVCLLWCPLHQGRGNFFLQQSQAAPVNPVKERKSHVCRSFSVVISVHVAEITSDLRSGSAYSASLYSLLQPLLSALQISSWLCCAIIFF